MYIFISCIYMYSYTVYVYIYIYANLPVNVIARLPHFRSGDSQGQKAFLASSADKQTRNYDIECSNHNPSLSTLRPEGLNHSKMKWWAIYTNLLVNAAVIISHPRNGNSQGKDTFLAPSADRQTRNYGIECWKLICLEN